MINGLDLFSGIGGISLALREWVKPIAYCEIDRYAQAVLLSRMSEGLLPRAPIWNDITTLDGKQFRGQVDIIYGGFPCQDISVAGNGKGLAGKRSWLFREIMRLAEELKPKFIFLENVPAIRTRGLNHVAEWLASAGYDCRWDIISAQEIGAPHIRQRWFCLAHANSRHSQNNVQQTEKRHKNPDLRGLRAHEYVANSSSVGGLPRQWRGKESERSPANPFTENWWAIEPDVDRVVNGLPFRVDRIKGLGNSVVPAQAREAFRRLVGSI